MSSRIQYLYKEGEEACSTEPLKVRLDYEVCGEIRKVDGGYQYFPKGNNEGGEIFKTVVAVQRDLKGG